MDESTTRDIRKEMENESSQHFKKQVAGFVILFVIACVGYFYWHSEATKDNRPSEQIQFEQRLTKLKAQANLSNSNEIRQERASNEMSAFLGQRTIINSWIGVVTGVEKTLFNGNGVRLRSYVPSDANGNSDAANQRICDFLKGLSNDELANLLENDKVEFSGEIKGSDELSFNGFVEAIFKNDIVQIENARISKQNTNNQEPVNTTEPTERSNTFGKKERKKTTIYPRKAMN